MTKFKTFKRSAGVLLSVSSLPGEYGIGCFSRDADAFIELISDMGFRWWQILPITALGAGNSPYSGASSFAGNTLYICPAQLQEIGLLSAQEVAACKYHGEPYQVDYDFARLNSERYLRLAFSRIDDAYKEGMREFVKSESYWLEDYALFSVLSVEYSTNWWKWDTPLRDRDQAALAAVKKEYADEIKYVEFCQYEFFREWSAIRLRAGTRGVSVIGDLPFYVSTDSADVWANQKLFQLDKNRFPRAIAGVPPDAFSSVGQVWGNCLYDFDEMKKDGYMWWRRRIAHCLKLYDALRLDHFRAFYNYFSIPATDYDTAANGHWEKGPADSLLDLVYQDDPNALFIAEDLGLIDEECRKYIDGTGIPTMRVFQFGFDGTESSHIPFRYEVNTVAYSGTHDNNTTLGWLYDLNDGARRYALKYCGFSGAGWGAGGPDCASVHAIIRTLMMSSSAMLVLPIQDMLGYGGDTRMNVPGVPEGNWKWRLAYHLMATVDRDFFLDMIKTYGRYGGGRV